MAVKARLITAKHPLEQEVILGAIRADRAHDGRVRELLRRGLDWQALRSIAQHHGVLPLLAIRLQEIGQDLTPHEEMARMQEFYAAHSRRNFVMTAELLRILSLFHSRGIEVIPFKGPVLAVQAYGDITLRQFDDVDVMVRRIDLQTIQALLTGQGYTLSHKFTPAQEQAHFKRANELTFISQNGNCILDVHWQYTADYLKEGFVSDGAFAAQTSVRLEGHQVPALPADDMVLFLCLHGVFHLWTRLCNISDVARYIEATPELDWHGLLRKAEENGLRRVFLLGVSLARDYFATESPAFIAEAVEEDRTIARLRRHVRSRLFGRGSDEPGFRETARLQLLAKDSFGSRLQYCFIRLFYPTVEDWSLISLPDRLYFLYFFIRLMRLAGIPFLKKP